MTHRSPGELRARETGGPVACRLCAMPARARRHLSRSLTFLGLTCVTFFIGRVIPIDPVLAIVGDKASPRPMSGCGTRSASTCPSPVQYWRYLMKVLHGDFGISVITAHPVLQDMLQVFPATMELALLGPAHRRGVRRAARRARRHPSRPLAGPGDPLRSPARLFDAGVLARAGRAAAVLRQARLGRRAGPARCRLTTTSCRRSPA